ncbi:MAG TPA: tRNA (adenosine(37)-N6)-threonylcarbamoyltransferase complex ATPase subunit type 1 TsaE [Candidatus Magasanikbacteria bacterium]|nr:tRNA (adenosine(37)-N6)-threonylcarbamoyltransferase complex ATPase subunit type 1 TsaE [Candidatus Magasanikbacteria bacterium]
MEYTTKNQEETTLIGKDIASQLQGGDILLLHGDLGAGKTTLTKGIAKYFEIDEVVSPTFTLMQEYTIRNPKSAVPAGRQEVRSLIHIDTYRLKDEEQLVEIGVEDYLGAPDTICLIEWPEKIKNLLKNKHIKNIVIKHQKDQERLINLDF